MPSIYNSSEVITEFPNKFASPFGNDAPVPIYSSIPESHNAGEECLPCVICSKRSTFIQTYSDLSATNPVTNALPNVTISETPASSIYVSQQPTSGTYNAGSPATLTAVGGGYGPFSYQWYKDDQQIAGATSSSYVISNVSGQEGNYYAIISNYFGTTTTNTAVISVFYPPSIVTQPVGVVADSGTSYTLSATASGSGSLSYQWYYNNTAISGATSHTYSFVVQSLVYNPDFSIKTPSTLGMYKVVVTNSLGSATSNSVAILCTEQSNTDVKFGTTSIDDVYSLYVYKSDGTEVFVGTYDLNCPTGMFPDPCGCNSAGTPDYYYSIANNLTIDETYPVLHDFTGPSGVQMALKYKIHKIASNASCGNYGNYWLYPSQYDTFWTEISGHTETYQYWKLSDQSFQPHP